jgi:hypothetical protein
MTRDTDAQPLALHGAATSPALLAQLEAYWRVLRGARAIPARTDVDPAAIDAVLPHAFVAERVAPGVARIRVAGQRLSALFGMEPRGMPLCALFTAAARERLLPLIASTFDGPAIVEVPVEAGRGLLRGRMAGRMILLPLCDAGGEVNRMIGAILCDGVPGRVPVRFALPTVAPRIEPVNLPEPLHAPRLAAVGERRQTPPLRPALRLVVSNG